MITDRHVLKFMPQIGHWEQQVGINQDGSLFATFHVAGMPAELAGAAATWLANLRENQLDRSVADPRVEIWDHYVRQDGQDMAALPIIPNWFGARFDDAYRATQTGSLYRNDLFVTVLMQPHDSFRSGLLSIMGAGAIDHPQASDAALEEFDTVIQKVEAGLARYGLRRLGFREEGPVVFSELAETFHLILTNDVRRIGVSSGRMGKVILPERIIFGHRDFQIVREGAPRFGAILSMLNYPARTRPVMFAALRNAPFPLTITNSRRFIQKAAALGKISLQIKQMQSGNDAAKSQIGQLIQEEDDIASGHSEAVSHHFSVAIYAPSLDALDRRVASAEALLSDAGVTAVRETDALKAAFYAQLPGNRRWRTRPEPVKSINAIAMAAKHGVPAGQYKGRWGAPVIMLRTTSNTEYALHLQVHGAASIPAEDLANCMIFGGAGSGKTSLLGSVGLLSLRNPSTRVVLIDKDFGLSVMVRAAGGSYLALASGTPSGLAPLLGLSNTPDDVSFIEGFIKKLILADEQGELSADEDQRLQRAVARQMQMPPALRGFAGIAAFLGMRSKDGAAARLRKWCRGERLGWAFDNDRDELRMETRMTGFDTTAILRNEEVCSPTLSYLFYRTRKLINGQPIVMMVDETWQSDLVPAFRDENNDQLKTIRKNEGAVVLATQSAYDALKSPNAHTFKQQIPTKIFFGDETASHADLVDGLGLTEAEYLAVTQTLPLLRHTFLIKRPGGSVLCRFDMSGAKEKIAVISARRSTYELSNRLIAQYGPEPEAWVPEFERLAPGIVDEPTLPQQKEIAA